MTDSSAAFVAYPQRQLSPPASTPVISSGPSVAPTP
jgi:hypothetical protein